MASSAGPLQPPRGQGQHGPGQGQGAVPDDLPATGRSSTSRAASGASVELGGVSCGARALRLPRGPGGSHGPVVTAPARSLTHSVPVRAGGESVLRESASNSARRPQGLAVAEAGPEGWESGPARSRLELRREELHPGRPSSTARGSDARRTESPPLLLSRSRTLALKSHPSHPLTPVLPGGQS